MNHTHLHQKAVEIIGRYKRAEAELVSILQEIDSAKSYLHYGCSSLFAYAVSQLGLTDDVAYIFINVARKAAQVPALQEAIAKSEITVSKAKKITSVITNENEAQWLSMAKLMPQKKLEKEVARVNPKAATPEKASYVTYKRLLLSFGVSEELFEQLKRVQDLESQRQGVACDYESTLKSLLDLYLQAKDPLRKNSKRIENKILKEESRSQQVLRPVNPGLVQSDQGVAAQRLHEQVLIPECHRASDSKESPSDNATYKMHSSRVQPKSRSRGDTPKTLSQGRKQFVLKQNQAQCTHIDSRGNRCTQTRWLHVHHLHEQAFGGTHSVQNLTVLCSSHHRFLHEQNHKMPSDLKNLPEFDYENPEMKAWMDQEELRQRQSLGTVTRDEVLSFIDTLVASKQMVTRSKP